MMVLLTKSFFIESNLWIISFMYKFISISPRCLTYRCQKYSVLAVFITVFVYICPFPRRPFPSFFALHEKEGFHITILREYLELPPGFSYIEC